MEKRKFKPMIDKTFWLIWVPTVVLLAVGTVIALSAPIALCIMAATDLFTLYFLITPLFGYVELREKTVYIKFGLLTDKEIPYEKIRDIDKERKIYADSMVSLKNSLEHVNIKYNRFDVVSVSVVTNDELISELTKRTSQISRINEHQNLH